MMACSHVMSHPFQKRNARETAIDTKDAESGHVLAVSFHSLNLLIAICDVFSFRPAKIGKMDETSV